jgi:hypothetical protein
MKKKKKKKKDKISLKKFIYQIILAENKKNLNFKFNILYLKLEFN